MRKTKRYLAVFMAALAACVVTGCSGSEIKDRLVSKIEGESQEPETDPTPTVPPEPTATPIPPTPTPVPTSTPAPRRIGTKTPQSKYVYLNNGFAEALREVYLRGSGEGDWGKNLLPVESTVKPAEKVQMCYTPSNTSGGLYDLKLVDKKGNSYAIYEVNLSDFEDGTIALENDVAVLTYISLTTGDETRAEYSEILDRDYSSPGSGSGSGSSDHEGDYNYGYYDDYGNWITYDYSSSSGSSSGDSGYDYYDDYDSYSSYDYSDNSYDSYVGDSNYGYYDDYGNWISYY